MLSMMLSSGMFGKMMFGRVIREKLPEKADICIKSMELGNSSLKIRQISTFTNESPEL